MTPSALSEATESPRSVGLPPAAWHQRSLWYGVIAPPFAWVIQEWTSVWLALQGCKHVADHPAVRAGLFGIAILGLAVAISGAIVGRRNYRALTRGARVLGAQGRPRDEMMALAGMFLGITCGLGILWSGVPTLMLLRVCEATR